MLDHGGSAGLLTNGKGTTWEGGFRSPLLIKWPGVIKPGTKNNDIISHEDMIPTLLAAVGEPDIAEKLKKGHKANGKDWKVHLDGYNFLPRFKGEAKEGPRDQIFYFGQGGELNAVRWNDWKIHFALQNQGWGGPREPLNFPRMVHLRSDPYEVSLDSGLYTRFFGELVDASTAMTGGKADRLRE